jgi:hypothetical protein
MDRNFVAALAVVALFGGGALYFIHEVHQRELAELRGHLQAAKQQAAAMEKARDAAEQARVAAEKARQEGGEVRWMVEPKVGEPPVQKAGEPPAQSVGADPAREAREAARVEALRARLEAAKKRAEEETLASERFDPPKLPEVRLTPKPGG